MHRLTFLVLVGIHLSHPVFHQISDDSMSQERKETFMYSTSLSESEGESFLVHQVKETQIVMMGMMTRMRTGGKFSFYKSTDGGKVFTKQKNGSTSFDCLITKMYLEGGKLEYYDEMNGELHIRDESNDTEGELIFKVPANLDKWFRNPQNDQALAVIVTQQYQKILKITTDGGKTYKSYFFVNDSQMHLHRWLNATTFLGFNRNITGITQISHITGNEIVIVAKNCNFIVSHDLSIMAHTWEESTRTGSLLFSKNGTKFINCTQPYEFNKLILYSIRVDGNNVYAVVSLGRDPHILLSAKLSSEDIEQLEFVSLMNQIHYSLEDDETFMVRKNVTGFIMISKYTNSIKKPYIMVSYNAGYTWNRIKVKFRENGNILTECQTNECCYSAKYYACKYRLTEEETESAPWLLFKCVEFRSSGYSQLSMMISRDFGLSFSLVERDFAHNFVMNYGGLIVCGTFDMKIKNYSIDEGRSWMPIPGDDSKPMKVIAWVNDRKTQVLIFGICLKSGTPKLIRIDFSKIINVSCKQADMQWIRIMTFDGSCIRGKEVRFKKKKVHHSCLLSSELIEQVEESCACDPRHFPCQKPFQLIKGKCISELKSNDPKPNQTCTIGSSISIDNNRDQTIISESCKIESDKDSETHESKLTSKTDLCLSNDLKESFLLLSSHYVYIIPSDSDNKDSPIPIFNVTSQGVTDITIDYHRKKVYAIINFGLYSSEYSSKIDLSKNVIWNDHKFPFYLKRIEVDPQEFVLYFSDHMDFIGVLNLLTFQFRRYTSHNAMKSMKFFPDPSVLIHRRIDIHLEVCVLLNTICSSLFLSHNALDYSVDAIDSKIYVKLSNGCISTSQFYIVSLQIILGEQISLCENLYNDTTHNMIAVSRGHLALASAKNLIIFKENQLKLNVTVEKDENYLDLKKVFRYSSTNLYCEDTLSNPICEATEHYSKSPYLTFWSAEVKQCMHGKFACDDFKCLHEKLVCDGIPDCDNGEDEKSCKVCKHPSKKCGNRCILKDVECDADKKCDDEVDDCDDGECPQNQFECADKKCIKIESICDGKTDCSSGEDEEACNKYLKLNELRCFDGKCINEDKACTKSSDCASGEDKSDKDGDDDASKKTIECGEKMFKCENGQCIDKSLMCDGKPDCQDKSDEKCNRDKSLCGDNMFYCENGVCLSSSLRCDGMEDCGNGEDEVGCKDICKSSNHRCPDGTCIPASKRCNDSDSETNNSTEIVCNEGETKCSDDTCIKSDLLCNGYRDCPDGSDEARCYGKILVNVSVSTVLLVLMTFGLIIWYTQPFQRIQNNFFSNTFTFSSLSSSTLWLTNTYDKNDGHNNSMEALDEEILSGRLD